jgi:hypothetical protein
MKQIKENSWVIEKNASSTVWRTEYFESDNQEYLIFYDDIEEYGIMQCNSSVEIWKNKLNPQLIFKFGARRFECQSDRCYYLEHSDILVLLTICIPQYQMCYMIIDPKEEKFSKVDCINYHLREAEKGEIVLTSNYRYYYPNHSVKEDFEKLNGAKFFLKDLEWVPLSEMTNYCQLPTCLTSGLKVIH